MWHFEENINRTQKKEGNRMKKWISIVLISSLLITNSSIGSMEHTIRAKADRKEVQTESVTDLEAYENNDLIVVYKDKSMTEKKMTKKTAKIGEVEESKTEVLTDDSVVVKLEDRTALKEAIEQYTEDSSVAYVQPNYVYHANNITITDSDYGKQWEMNNDGTLTYQETIMEKMGWYDYRKKNITVTAQADIDVNAPEAWELGTGANREVVVAFVDTGIKYEHEDLKRAMWTNPGEIPGDGIDNDGNGYVDDVYGWNFYAADEYNQDMTQGNIYRDYSYSDYSNGNNTYYNQYSEEEDSHATHCAGVLAAQANGLGIVGIAHQQNVKIMTVKVLGGVDGSGTTESVVKGIQYAIDNGARICNLSLGGEEDDRILRDVIQENPDILFCIAAGNGDRYGVGYDMDKKGAMKEYPACYTFDNIITVANIQCDGALHYTSNYGGTSVDIAAPGARIYSTSTVGTGYEYMTGTSMATPIVSGIAAMLYSYCEDITVQEIKNIILDSSKKLSSLDGKVVCGGMADAYAALLKKKAEGKTETPLPSASAKASETPLPSASAKASETPLPSPSAQASETPLPSASAKASEAPLPSASAKASETPLPSASAKASETPLPSASAKASETPLSSPSTEPIKTPDAEPEQTPNVTELPSKEPEETKEPSAAPTGNPLETTTPVPDATRSPEPTASPVSPTCMPAETEKPESTLLPATTTKPVVTTKPTSAPVEEAAETLGTSTDTKLDHAQIILKTNKKIKLMVHNLKSGSKVTWKSSNKSVASIASNGIVTAKAPGKATIKAVLSNGKTLSCTVVVYPVTPSNVKATQVNRKRKVKISWGSVTKIDGYEVLRATSKNGRYRVIKDVTKSGTKYYADTKVLKRSYYYKVRAYKKLAGGSRIYSDSSSPRKVTVK